MLRTSCVMLFLSITMGAHCFPWTRAHYTGTQPIALPQAPRNSNKPTRWNTC
ncbi:MAG: hypothetical protein QM811_28645 [Pirellulales bacterium]